MRRSNSYSACVMIFVAAGRVKDVKPGRFARTGDELVWVRIMDALHI